MIMNTHITQASEQLVHGFANYYEALVTSFANSQDQLTYQQFAYRTARATKPLESEAEAIFYTVAYGYAHFAGFQNLLQQSLDFVETPVHVIDYGCGQGIATLALIEHLVKQDNIDHTNMSLHIHLIEPSMMSLNIAVYLIEKMAKAHHIKVNIDSQNCTLAEAQLPDGSMSQCIHFMSNIIDIETVQAQLPRVTKHIEHMQGEHFMLVASPNYANSHTGMNLLKSYLPTSEVFLQKNIYLNHRVYGVVNRCWQQRGAQTSMMALHYLKDKHHNDTPNDTQSNHKDFLASVA